MASSTVTIDTGEWIYVDSNGVEHTVSNAETFTLTVTDGGASNVEYDIPSTAQQVGTTDDLKINLLPNVSGQNVARTLHFLTDAGEGSDFYNIGGELRMQCPTTGRVQIWTVAKINPSDADFGSAGTITMTLEDQFGNVMVMPATGAGITVGQAS